MTTTLGEAAANVLAKTPRPWNGEKITEPGAYLNIPLSEYHGNPDLFDGPAISSSGLRRIFSDGPAHYWATSLYNPKGKRTEQTEAMILGSATHWLVADEPEFNAHFAVMPEYIHSATGAGSRTAKNAWVKDLACGRTVLTPPMMERVTNMVAAVKTTDLINRLGEGMPEVSMFFRDEKTGVWVKSRPDSMLSDWSVGMDLKCVNDVKDVSLGRAMDNSDYRMQAALIRQAVKVCIGVDMSDFAFLFVESDDPYCVRGDSMWGEDLDFADEQNRVCLDVFKHCWDRGEWPGPKNRGGDFAYFRMSEYERARKAQRIEALQELVA